ncbi:ABC transporter permease [Lewinella sp. IMCC34191]|uniref:ABC transporter permease n=1 Tax=Lewinella sp. IMCC34191 TaxID=2259172 RepID=UPI000E239D27|nr:ABC transporter permease [Lewinella sp. IMCC34191]
MLTSIRTAFAEAFQNLRNNFFQTLLSVLGIIIGVAALVAMLAIIDGLEQMAREGVAKNSSLETVVLRATTSREVDGIRVPLEDPVALQRGLIDSVVTALPYPTNGQLVTGGSVLINHPDTATELAIAYTAVTLPLTEDAPEITIGRELRAEDDTDGGTAMLINDLFARRLIGPADSLAEALGRRLQLFGGSVEIVGIAVTEENETTMMAILPLAVLENLPDAPQTPRVAMINFDRVEDVTPGRDSIAGWFAARFPEIEEPVQARANLEVVKQLETGFTVFRFVMSFLIGIAVVVGGVGVMNVLLMSIAERTPEIGVRKAVGAAPRRILTQFLSESVAISTLGSLIGLIFGGLAALAIAAIISYVLEVDFHAVFTFRTLMIVFTVAILTGIVFGTYPARRAARLDPVAAIQRS